MLTAFSLCACVHVKPEALTSGEAHTAPPCWQSPLMATDWVWSAEKVIRPERLEDKSFTRGTSCVLLQGSAHKTLRHPQLAPPTNTTTTPQQTSSHTVLACCNEAILSLSLITPAAFRGPPLPNRNILPAGVHTQDCRSVTLHQFHSRADSEGAAFNWLLGCHYNSNNNRYFKANGENWKQAKWKWSLFFFDILFSIFFFSSDNAVICVCVCSEDASSCDLCRGKFFMMPGFSYVRRRHAL